jgi:hypothetical protein
LFRAFKASDALRERRDGAGSVTVIGTSVLNEISHQGTAALPYGFGRIADDFAAGSPIGLVLDKEFNNSRKGKSCALAHIKR